jgi:RNA polymerase sigma-70 factor, ECF subfamily
VAVRADSLVPEHRADDAATALATELFREHSRMVLGLCRRLLADRAEAEDAMQQTFVSAYRSILAGSEPRRPDVWLAAIARNECLDRIRSRMREPLAEGGRNGGSATNDALATLIADEELRTLARSIQELPDRQRDALVLHELCGLPYGEVAATIGVSESAIGSLLFRARASLRSAFRRAYALLPLPPVWDAVAQLSRGPAIKAAALPVVLKLGGGAAAVALTAGAVVAVEHEVAGQYPPHSGSPRVSAAPAEHHAGTSAPVAGPAPATTRRAAQVFAAVVVPRISNHTAKHARAAHRTADPPRRRASPVPETAASAHVVASTPAEAPPADTHATQSVGSSSTAPGHVHSVQGSNGGAHVDKGQGYGTSHGGSLQRKAAENQNAAATKPVPAGTHARSVPDGSTAPAVADAASGQVPEGGAAAGASTPSADAAPSASGNDHFDHPDHPDHPVKS